jgi:hypothetical protein
MNCRDFSAALRAFADVLDIAGAPVARDRIILFAAAFDAHATSEISDLAKNLAAVPPTASTGNPRLGEVACLLSALKNLLNKTAKNTVLTDVSAIEKLMADRASMELGAFVQMAAGATVATGRRRRGATGMRDDLVGHYQQKLEAALGDDEKFAAIFNDLRTNIAMGKPEIAALAKEMTGSSARTQDAALKKIWNRHQSLVVFKAKSRATAGRSAA